MSRRGQSLPPNNTAADVGQSSPSSSVSRSSPPANSGPETQKVKASGRPNDQMSTELLKADLLNFSKGMRSRMLTSLGDAVKKSVLDDPDLQLQMWSWARSLTTVALDQFWTDVETEIERALEASILVQRKRSSFTQRTLPSGCRGWLVSHWLQARAFILHAYLPHNKSIYGKFRDPMYLLLYFITLLPIHGLRVMVFSVLLVMLLLPAPPDEYQLVNYILVFKGFQFLTSGFISMARGALQYYACYSWQPNDLLNCIETQGPGTAWSVGQFVDWLGSVALVWIAFSVLPNSRRHEFRPLVDTVNFLAHERDDAARRRLKRFMHYDIMCFLFSLALLGLLTVSNCDSSSPYYQPHFRENAFWCFVLYSMLSLPFALLAIPFLRPVLIHGVPTGYDEDGKCVRYELPSCYEQSPQSPETEQHEAEVEAEVGGFWNSWWVVTAVNVMRTAARGRAIRGLDESTWTLRDYWRGVRYRTYNRMYNRVFTATADQEEREIGRSARQERRRSWWHSRRHRGLVEGAVIEEGEDETQARSERRHLTLPLLWKSSSGPLPPEQRQPRRLPTGVSQQEVTLPVASARLLPDGIKRRRGVTYFTIEAVAEGSLDAEGGGGSSWRVRRSCTDFQGLAARLAAQYVGEEEAEPSLPIFPSGMHPRNWLQLEDQRRELNAWLSQVVQDSRSQDEWAAELWDFLQVDRPRDADHLSIGIGAAEGDATSSFFTQGEAACSFITQGDPGASFMASGAPAEHVQALGSSVMCGRNALSEAQATARAEEAGAGVLLQTPGRDPAGPRNLADFLDSAQKQSESVQTSESSSSQLRSSASRKRPWLRRKGRESPQGQDMAQATDASSSGSPSQAVLPEATQDTAAAAAGEGEAPRREDDGQASPADQFWLRWSEAALV